MRGYHCCNTPRRPGMRVPHASVLRVGVCTMPKGLKRYYGHGHLHFLTFSCYRRLPLLNTPRARNLFVQTLGKIRERYQFLLVGYVVMPNHVHLLISEPKKDTPSVVLKVLKQRVSRDLRKRARRTPAAQLRLTFARGVGGDLRVPQVRRSQLRSVGGTELHEKVACMH